MPRYLYKCTQCKELTVGMHSYKEKLTECEKCDAAGSLIKMLSRPNIQRKIERIKKVGEVTEEFIEDAREELIIQKEELIKQG